jgi:hypothetical protein
METLQIYRDKSVEQNRHQECHASGEGVSREGMENLGKDDPRYHAYPATDWPNVDDNIPQIFR